MSDNKIVLHQRAAVQRTPPPLDQRSTVNLAPGATLDYNFAPDATIIDLHVCSDQRLQVHILARQPGVGLYQRMATTTLRRFKNTIRRLRPRLAGLEVCIRVENISGIATVMCDVRVHAKRQAAHRRSRPRPNPQALALKRTDRRPRARSRCATRRSASARAPADGDGGGDGPADPPSGLRHLARRFALRPLVVVLRKHHREARLERQPEHRNALLDLDRGLARAVIQREIYGANVESR